MTDPQPALFDASRSTTQKCPVRGCEALRFPTQERTPTCNFDRDRALGEPGRRPAGCLNEIRPEHQAIPY